MKFVNKKAAILLAAAAASISVVGCGKKKEVGNPSAPQRTEIKTEQVNGSIEGELPMPNNESNAVPLAPQPDSQTVAVGSAPKVSEVRPVKIGDLNPLPLDYESNNSSSVVRDGLSKRITGGKTSDSLLYTGTSTDGIHTYLRSRNEKVGWETRRLNFEAAASVKSAKLTVDSLSGEAIIVLKLEENKILKTYVLAGDMTTGSANILGVVNAGAGAVTSGSQALQGTIKCLDLDGMCENSYLRIKVGGQGVSSAIINVIFRQSAADLYFHLPGEYTDSSEYSDIREMIVNSIKRINSDNRISKIVMNSFEVVNGRSGVDVYIQSRNKELLGFSGPLLAPEAGTAVNVGLSRIGNEANDTLDLLALNQWNLNYQNTIAEARMINNNGLGQIRIALKMRKRGQLGGEQFAMTIMRKIKPIIELNETSLDIK
jgi:hypothetical protein